MDKGFGWGSALGVSVALFLVIGALWLFVGAMTIPFVKTSGSEYLIVSNRADAAYYGEDPPVLLAEGSPIAKFRTVMVRLLAGHLVVAGVLVIAVAWFGLRQSEVWALVALGGGVVLAVAIFIHALWPYFSLGFRIGLRDLPPLVSAPTLLVIPAVVLGWIGLASDRLG